MLEIRNLTAGYSGRQVLKNISLAFPAGAVTVIAGPNGCGKTTLLKALAGVLEYQGEILLEGQPLSGCSARERARKIAYLPQSRQVPQITVGRLVLHGRFPYLRYPRQYRREDYAAAEAAMARMGLTELKDRELESLSGGQRQKAYIAMALAQETGVVLLDEPTSFLDIAHQLQLMEQAKDLAAQGKTVVLVLHDLPLALEHGDHLVLLKEGTLLTQGTPEAVFHSGSVKGAFGVDMGRTRTENGWKYYYI